MAAFIGMAITLWLFIIGAQLVFFYPREIRRVPGPEGMVAILRYGPSSNPLLLLLPISGTHNNCHVFVDVETGGRKIATVQIADGGDMLEDHDESRIQWRPSALIVVDEHSGLTNGWSCEQRDGTVR